MIKGQNITKIRTLNSMYDNDCIGLTDDKGNEFRLNVQELNKILNDLRFRLTKKRKHTYLEIIENEFDLVCGECGYPLKDLKCSNIECHKYNFICPICTFPTKYVPGNQYCICNKDK